MIGPWPYLKKNYISLTILFTTWLIFFSPILSGQRLYFLDDLKVIFYPLEHVYTEFQRDWQLPLWSPNFGFGHPLLAWGQLGFFTPLHLILRALHITPLPLLQISIVSYFAFGLCGMYLFLRRQQLAMPAATLGALVFTLSGFNIGHLNHINFYVATMVLPWLLITIDIFLKKPTLQRAAVLALPAAIITMSAHAQMALYTLLAAALIGFILFAMRMRNTVHTRTAQRTRTIILTVVAAILALSLAAINLLPLLEFIPWSDRASALPHEQLFEFSYAPSHAITLIFPYFFGDHTSYWGTKNFQELAAYTGLIPLVLAGMALTTWRSQRSLRLAGSLLIVGGITIALGRYSPLYSWLVNHDIITFLAIPGRFVFFVDIGLALLAAVGLNDVIHSSLRTTSRLWIGGTLLPLALLLPFLYRTAIDMSFRTQLLNLWHLQPLQWWTVLVGCLALLGTKVGLFRQPQFTSWLLVAVSAFTLIVYGWSYNPRASWAETQLPTPLMTTLNEYQVRTGLPPRLYTREHLFKQIDVPDLDTYRSTDPITPTHSLYQEFKATHNNLECIALPLEWDKLTLTPVSLTIYADRNAPPLREAIINPAEIESYGWQKFCFSPLPDSQNQSYTLALTSQAPSGIKFLYEPTSNATDFHIVRVSAPTNEQFMASRKPFHLAFESQYQPVIDPQTITLARHLQVTVPASSARWISALSVGSYRAFIDRFFANDSEPVDGDGRHFIERHRQLFNASSITHLIQLIEPAAIDQLPQQGFEPRTAHAFAAGETRLYENPSAAPRAYLVPQARVSDPTTTLIAFGNNTFDPYTLVYLDNPLVKDATLPTTSPAPLTSAAEITRYQPTTVTVRTSSNAPAWLVLTDSWTPEWHVTIDGASATSWRANTVFRAVAVPEGTHQVTWSYHSPAATLGSHISLVAFATTLILLLSPYLFRVRKLAAS